jgi:uncharacterized protein YgiM (DUF1202 family)
MGSLLVVILLMCGSTAGVAASTAGVPTWGGSLGELQAGPLGLNEPPPPPAASAQLPVAMSIPGMSMNAGVEVRSMVGGVMQDPTTPYIMSWYDFSSYVGSDSNAVFAGHVNWYGVQYGVLYGMTSLPAGAQIYVTGADGGTYTYEVEYIYRVNIYDMTESDLNAIIGGTGYGALTIITCGTDGGWNGSEYVTRDILRAKLVSSDANGGAQAAASQVSSVPEGPNASATDALAAGDTATVNSGTLNLRADAVSDAEIVAKLAQGDTVTVTGEAKIASGFTWWPVTTADGSAGWVAGEYLLPAEASDTADTSPTPEATATAEPTAEPAADTPAETGSGSTTATVTADTLNVRASASTDADVVATLVLGDEVTITGRSVTEGDFTWWPVETADGTTGWVAGEFIELPAGESGEGA